MVDNPRTAKSASKWKRRDLRAYHITLRRQNVVAFFNVPQLPAPGVTNNEVLNHLHRRLRRRGRRRV